MSASSLHFCCMLLITSHSLRQCFALRVPSVRYLHDFLRHKTLCVKKLGSLLTHKKNNNHYTVHNKNKNKKQQQAAGAARAPFPPPPSRIERLVVALACRRIKVASTALHGAALLAGAEHEAACGECTEEHKHCDDHDCNRKRLACRTTAWTWRGRLGRVRGLACRAKNAATAPHSGCRSTLKARRVRVRAIHHLNAVHHTVVLCLHLRLKQHLA